jgi:hypothetical protein
MPGVGRRPPMLKSMSECIVYLSVLKAVSFSYLRSRLIYRLSDKYIFCFRFFVFFFFFFFFFFFSFDLGNHYRVIATSALSNPSLSFSLSFFFYFFFLFLNRAIPIFQYEVLKLIQYFYL